MTPILELKPPSFSEIKQDSELIEKSEIRFEEKKPTTKKFDTSGLKKASQGWIIAGFIFSFLGGYLGIAIGFNYAFGNYRKETKGLGWIMGIIGIFSLVIWKSI
jgi:hypothetical protein